MAYNYSDDLRDVNKSQHSNYYVPVVDFMTMKCEEMQTNYNTLADQVQLWQTRLAATNDGATKQNINSILKIQTEKLDGYRNALNDCADIAAELAKQNDPNSKVAATAEVPVEDKNKKLIKYLALGVGGFFALIILIWAVHKGSKK